MALLLSRKLVRATPSPSPLTIADRRRAALGPIIGAQGIDVSLDYAPHPRKDHEEVLRLGGGRGVLALHRSFSNQLSQLDKHGARLRVEGPLPAAHVEEDIPGRAHGVRS